MSRRAAIHVPAWGWVALFAGGVLALAVWLRRHVRRAPSLTPFPSPD
ncbi:MAG: hypothetical protein ACYDDI_17555 [Candidatus Acidiferrales bacterium]